MNNPRLITVAAVTLLATAPGFAQDTSPAAASDGNSIFSHPGWYVTPMFSYMKNISWRQGVDDGMGGVLALGHYEGAASFEVWGQYLSAGHEAWSYSYQGPATNDPTDDETVTVSVPAGTVKFTGVGVGMLVAPYFEDRILGRFFLLVGGGMNRRENHPQQPQADNTIFLDAGIGYVHPLQLWGHHSGLRTDLRWRYDIQDRAEKEIFYREQPEPRPRYYEDLVLNVGVSFGLSKQEAAPPVPAPVQVVQVTDADGDGVPDERDTCPDTPSGSTVDDTGCVPAAPPPPSPPTLETAKAGDTIVLHGVNFETARATLTGNARTILDGVAEKLVARAELRVEIGGHTDSRGSDEYNQRLSEQRAQSVMSYLVEHGVADERLSAVGYGEAQPVDGNETDEGMERNRRVELKILDQASVEPAADPATDATTPPVTGE
jgi:outer membrane protein OmpA-like peptidoglycan-associated protein